MVMKQIDPSLQSDYAPALDSEPVFERPAEGRWDIAQRPEPFSPFAPPAAGSWADTRSAFDVGSEPGPGFLDPGTHALENHVAPMLASESMHFGAMNFASGDLLNAPPTEARASFDPSGGGDDDAPKPPKPPKPRK
jgi:hypothetical protein